jgi:hypothetical protein
MRTVDHERAQADRFRVYARVLARKRLEGNPLLVEQLSHVAWAVCCLAQPDPEANRDASQTEIFAMASFLRSSEDLVALIVGCPDGWPLKADLLGWMREWTALAPAVRERIRAEFLRMFDVRSRLLAVVA